MEGSKMNDLSNDLKGKAFDLENFISYATDSVVSKTLLKNEW
jgi:hypothetical protein